jgi:hypothetical protein
MMMEVVAASVELAASTAYVALAALVDGYAGARAAASRLRADAHHTYTMVEFVVHQRTVAVVDLAACARAGTVAIVAIAHACATTMAATVVKQNREAECTKQMALLFVVQMTVFEKASVPAALVDHVIAAATVVVALHRSRSTMESMTLWDQP